MILRVALVLFVLSAGLARAVDLMVPTGSLKTYDATTASDVYVLPRATYRDGHLPAELMEGQVRHQVWQIKGITRSSRLIEPLRRQILAAGFDILLDCQAAVCGGFDFRFNIDVVQAPDMFVDLVDYRFLSATKETTLGKEALSVLVSHRDETGLIQIITVSPESAETRGPEISTQTTLQPEVPATGETLELLDQLAAIGRVVLSDLRFDTGSANLSAGQFDSLATLGAFLAEDRKRRIALVGHTDNVGSLANNIALSKRRAGAVRSRLQDLGADLRQIEAEGVGYLSPLARNDTTEGRELNRRVEAVLLSPFE